nr:hypothetical protein CFP56_42178 [Quercus suber]
MGESIYRDGPGMKVMVECRVSSRPGSSRRVLGSAPSSLFVRDYCTASGKFPVVSSSCVKKVRVRVWCLESDGCRVRAGPQERKRAAAPVIGLLLGWCFTGLSISQPRIKSSETKSTISRSGVFISRQVRHLGSGMDRGGKTGRWRE